MDKKLNKHEKKEDQELLKLNKELTVAKKEATEQKSIIVNKPSLKTMLSNKMHLFTADDGNEKAQIKINGKLYEFTLTAV